ncbi:chemotaxis protein CheD [Rhodovulum euryhalinum]|uniref:Probable chemoreceptor glutamine deamidase CheD n=1 Tax=Rhodovulum euryhalinum TaxID=35805 RepID=A0A4R2KIT6_9RHOB|nr:chemotaxis protein CheD [Rhodovulum euryhalinum]TCO72317.1 chemotaxis protein CheD [Rhodovulum euryhalinum]
MNMFSSPQRPPQDDWPTRRIEPVIQGEFRVSRDPEIVLSTVLGSCVSACIFDPLARVGGMNHFLLPGDEGSNKSELKYGAMAMELLINELLKSGAVRSRLRVKLFGGARVSAAFTDIGEKNVIFARSYLRREGFEVLSESLGGQQARRLHFRPATGAARLVMLPPTEAPPERRVPRPVSKQDPEITLF